MADTKVSALASASVVNASDYLMIVQAGNSLKVDIETLTTKLPTRVQVIEASESLIVSGAVATNKVYSTLKALTTPAAYTLAVGTHGMEKIIVCDSVDVTTPVAVLTITAGAGITTATFNAIGDSLHLKNINAYWYVISANGVSIV